MIPAVHPTDLIFVPRQIAIVIFGFKKMKVLVSRSFYQSCLAQGPTDPEQK